MSTLLKARASARALLSAIPSGAGVGAVIGLALGGAYLAGGMAQDASTHATVSRLADAAAQGFSDQALEDTAARHDAGVLALARRYEGAGAVAAGDHQSTELAARLQGRTVHPASSVLMHAAYRAGATVAAAPYRAGALDQTRELDCLAQAVYYEARGETPAGQAAVAQVVLNRVRHPAFPKSICAVVFQGAQTGHGCQFSFACNGSMRNGHEVGAWDRAKRIASRAFDGQVMADVGNATHFHVVSISPNWAGLMKVAQIGTHIFYRFGGRAGAPQAFNLQPHLIETLIEPTVASANQPQLILASALTSIEPIKADAPATTAAAAKAEPAKAEAVKAEAAKTDAAAKPATAKPEAAAAKTETPTAAS